MLRSLRCCLDPKVIGGLVAVGVAVWLIAPAAGTGVLPLLVALVCPLSMGIMAWQMRGSSATSGATSPASPASAPVVAETSADEEQAIERARQQLAERNDQTWT